jgi:hypothetical protein
VRKKKYWAFSSRQEKEQLEETQVSDSSFLRQAVISTKYFTWALGCQQAEISAAQLKGAPKNCCLTKLQLFFGHFSQKIPKKGPTFFFF